MFQSLIGELQTNIVRWNEFGGYEFQSLIGELQTR